MVFVLLLLCVGCSADSSSDKERVSWTEISMETAGTGTSGEETEKSAEENSIEKDTPADVYEYQEEEE